MREHQSFDRSGLRNSTRIFRGSLMSQDAGFEGPRVRYTRNEAVSAGTYIAECTRTSAFCASFTRFSHGRVSPEITIERSEASKR